MSEVLKIRAKKNTCARLFALDWIRYATTIRQKRFRVRVSVGVRNLVVVIWSYKLLQVQQKCSCCSYLGGPRKKAYFSANVSKIDNLDCLLQRLPNVTVFKLNYRRTNPNVYCLYRHRKKIVVYCLIHQMFI